MLTSQTLKTGLKFAVVATLALASCAASNTEREPNTDTPSKMDATVAANIASNTTSSATDADSGSVATKKEKKMSDSTETAGESKAKSAKYEAPIRNEKNHIVLLETNHGDLTLELWRDLAPNHADSFLARVKDGFYDGLLFHRVMSGFMIQGGDPTGTGIGHPDKPGYNLDAEFSDEPHHRGILSMARRGRGDANDPKGFNTASCQFFICHAEARMLDKQYTVFGNLIAGYKTLDAIASTKTGAQDRPVEDCIITKASVIK